MNELVLADGNEPEMALSKADVEAEIQVVDDLIARSLEMQDASMAFGYVRAVGKLARLKGIGVARVLYETWVNWPAYQEGGMGDEWENVAPLECGLSLDQCRKYRDLYKFVYANPEIPQRIKDALVRKPIEGQLLLKAAVREKQLSDDDWEDIIDAVSPREMSDVVKRVRGLQTSAGSRLVIVIDREGLIKAKRQNSPKYVVVGVLRNSREDTEGDGYEPTIRSLAIERILRSAGIVEV